MTPQKKEVKMKVINRERLLVALEQPEDIGAALVLCEKCGYSEAVFFVPGYPPFARCRCGERPDAELSMRLARIVRQQPDVHVRAGECFT